MNKTSTWNSNQNFGIEFIENTEKQSNWWCKIMICISSPNNNKKKPSMINNNNISSKWKLNVVKIKRKYA